jgi:hypothetical protein
MTTSHLTNPAKYAGQVIGYSHSTKSPKNGNQVAGYAALRKKFLAYISTICGAAKFFASSRYAACLLTPFSRLADDSARAAFACSGSASSCGAFGRTLNF